MENPYYSNYSQKAGVDCIIVQVLCFDDAALERARACLPKNGLFLLTNTKGFRDFGSVFYGALHHPHVLIDLSYFTVNESIPIDAMINHLLSFFGTNPKVGTLPVVMDGVTVNQDKLRLEAIRLQRILMKPTASDGMYRLNHVILSDFLAGLGIYYGFRSGGNLQNRLFRQYNKLSNFRKAKTAYYVRGGDCFSLETIRGRQVHTNVSNVGRLEGGSDVL
jgi:hypothetical protein